MTDGRAEAFEAALRANPDDVVGWSAYADYLAETDDPRGEFVRVQLALEDPALDKPRRRALQKREDELLDDYGLEFLGRRLAHPLAGNETGGLSRAREVRFRRGFLAALSELVLTADLAKALARAREAKFLAELHVLRLAAGASLAPLAAAPFAPFLRSFSFGSSTTDPMTPADGLLAFVAAAGRLESLSVAAGGVDTRKLFALPVPTLTSLAVSTNQVHTEAFRTNPSFTRLTRLALDPRGYGGPRAPLTPEHLPPLTRSPYLTALTHLRLSGTGLGDDGLREIIASELIYRLESLDLTFCGVTDGGVWDLADALEHHPHRLKLFRVYGPPSRAGDGGPADRLRRLGVEVPPVNTGEPGSPTVDEPADFEPEEYDDDWE